MRDELILAVISSIPEPIFVLSRDGVYLNALGGSDRSRYHDAGHLIGKNLKDVIHNEIADEFLSKIEEAIDTRKTLLYTYSLSDTMLEGNAEKEGPKGLQWYEAHISPVIEEDDTVDKVIWIAFNITRLSNLIKKKEEQGKLYEKLANIDALTGLYNRRCFFYTGDVCFSSFKNGNISEISLLMIDLDFFKKINDTYGHDAGDTVLVGFSREIKKLLREEDFIGRVGGEEFAVLFSNKNRETAFEIAERIREHMAATEICFEEHSLRFTISIGVSSVIASDTSLKDVLKRADKALYKAKRNGRNKVV